MDTDIVRKSARLVVDESVLSPNIFRAMGLTPEFLRENTSLVSWFSKHLVFFAELHASHAKSKAGLLCWGKLV